MPTARKLPSGSWRCQVFSHYEYIRQPNGDLKQKRIYKSFTSDDQTKRGKKLAELEAAQFLVTRKEGVDKKLTVYTAVDKYIEARSSVISPSTLRSYHSLFRCYFGFFKDIMLHDLSNDTIQLWIGSIACKTSPKTVRNAHALLSSTINTFMPEYRLNTKLPQKIKPDLYVPCDDDIKKLLCHVQGTELEIAVLLAAFGPLRRGEICAITYDDIKGNKISINKAMVLTENKEWIIKPPKTYAGNRVIEFPSFVIKKIGKKSGRIIEATPDQISSRFRRALKKSGLPHFRFHDLRHYSASIQHALGVPDSYIMQRGGWESDNVLKQVYRNTIDDQTKKFTKHLISHFNDMQHDIQHESKKVL